MRDGKRNQSACVLFSLIFFFVRLMSASYQPLTAAGGSGGGLEDNGQSAGAKNLQLIAHGNAGRAAVH